ncbi:MAG TPA: MmgE/PrpD family protein, partial [Rhabdaerophilum sp.]|nr:MmgE/PrpD family protein [Rhabdaerophilum sp.]
MTDSLTPVFVIKGAPLTEAIVAFAAMPADAIPASARHVMRLSLADWCAVALAGKDEPVSRITREMIEAEAGAQVASLVGSTRKVPARAAALVNGATSHALDYDDTHFDHIGHPSVAIIPAALAMAEMTGASGANFLDAALIGVEASVRIGTWLGREHYQHGFHQTATAGAFGAAIAAGRLAGLDRGAMAQAVGIAATRASGLKSQFGTMGKPYHAGMAAANGVEAVLLAKSGFVSRPDGLECDQGFGPTHAGAALPLGPILEGLGSEFRFERVQHKFHACCHGTHAMLEALAGLRDRVRVDDVEIVSVATHPRWLRVCHILAPATGLEAKFSYRLTAAMALGHVDTGALASFTDALCFDPALVSLRDRVKVETDETLADTATRVRLRLVG